MMTFPLYDTWASKSISTPGLDDLVGLAATICGAPTALVSLREKNEIRVVSVFGETPPAAPSPEESFCIHAPDSDELLIVPDATKDCRFENNPMVTGDPGIRFYAGAPLMSADGTQLGILCVIDYQACDLNEPQRRSLKMLAGQVVGKLQQQAQERISLRKDRLLNGILDSPEDCLKLLGPDGSLRMINQAGLEMIQADLYEVQGRCVYPLVQKPQREAFIDLTRRVFAGESGTLQYQIIGLKGRPLWLETHATPLISENGNVESYLAVTRDITEKHAAEERIGHLNRVYSMMSSINQQVVREKDLQTFLGATCRIAAEKGLFRMAWIGLVDGNDQKLKIRAHARVDDDQLMALKQSLSGDRPLCDFTYDAVRTGLQGVCNQIEHDPRSVEWRELALGWGLRSMVSLPLTDGDQVIGTLNLYSPTVDFFDVEELRLLSELAADVSFAIELAERDVKRREVDAALRESEDQLSNALKIANMAHWEFDIDAEQFVFNDQFYNLMQTSAEQQGGYRIPKAETLSRFIHPDDLERVQKTMEDALILEADEHTCDFETRVIHGDESVGHLAVRFFVEQDEHGKTIRLRGVDRHITEYKLLEEEFRQSQKMEAIGQLAGGVAHDFNNLLTVINGYGTMLMLGEVEKDQTHEAIEQIVEAAERAGSLTRQLLAFSRRQIMEPKVLHLNQLVTQLTRMLERILGEHIKLVLDLTPNLPAVNVDAGMLDQLVLNLAVNARDAMEGGGQLQIRTSASSKPIAGHSDVGSVRLEVSDTGCGMAPEILDRIYEPFFTTKEQGKGTGLGLSTVFGIVKQHGAEIGVRSVVDEGTCFSVGFPATKQAIDTDSDAVALQAALERGNETILLVEDEPAVRMLGRSLLERAGYEVLEASDGHQAVEVFSQNQEKIDLLFTDMVMPEGMTGHELAVRLQKLRPDLRVIFTSGYSADTTSRGLRLEVGKNFVQKPSHPQTTLQTIRRNLDSAVELQSYEEGLLVS